MCFFFNDTATTEIYTLSLHDALPISRRLRGYMRATQRTVGGREPRRGASAKRRRHSARSIGSGTTASPRRSEEHTSELQSRPHLVCRLLLEKKKTEKQTNAGCLATTI